MTKLAHNVFTVFAFSSLFQQAISQTHCERKSQMCRNGGTCDSYTGQCHCAGAKGTLCQYSDTIFTEGSDQCRAALECANGSLCLEFQASARVCMCDSQQAGVTCNQPLYQLGCTPDSAEFMFRVETVYEKIVAIPLLQYDKPTCMISSTTPAATAGTGPVLPTTWVALRGSSVFLDKGPCYNVILTEEGHYSVYTLHYAIRHESPHLLLKYDSVVTLQCKVSLTNTSDIHTKVTVRPLHEPNRKLELHFRSEIQEVFGDMKVLTWAGQPFPVQTVLEVGDIVIFEFSLNSRHNLYNMTLGIEKLEAYPNEVTSDVHSTVLIEKGCVLIQGAVPSLERSLDKVRLHFRAFRFRQSDKLHLVFTVTACSDASLCTCQDVSRRRREATTGTASTAHSEAYSVTLKLKPLHENTWPEEPSFGSCLKMSEFWSLVTIATLAMTVAILFVVAIGGAVWFSSRPQK